MARFKAAYDAGVDTLDKYKESKLNLLKEISALKEDIKILELRIKHADTKVSVERLSIIKEFKARLATVFINEKSPYLLQHAYNSVDWYPWGSEAFEKAKMENKPIFLKYKKI